MSVKEQNKEEELPIKVNYYLDTNIVGEKNFDPETPFSEVLNYFTNNLTNSGQLILKEKYILNNREVNPEEPVKNLIYVQTGTELNNGEIWLEVNRNISTIEDDPRMTEVMKPKQNPFGLAIYRTKEGSVNIENYPEGIIKKYGLEKFNYSSAYCDSPKNLYISGGEKQGEVTKDFWIIDHEKHRIKYKTMPHAKANHSMIWVKEDLVFIVGGNDKKTFYYDPKYDEFINCGDLNGIHSEPALLRYDDYLYCFNSLINDIEYFERTSITRFSGKWEKVFPNYDSEEARKFDNKGYGVARLTGPFALLVGGSDTDATNYTYNFKENILSCTKDGKDEDIELADKKFYRISDKYYICIPKYFEEDQDLAIINMMTKSMGTIHYNESFSYNNNKLNKEDQELKNKNVGELFVKAKIFEANGGPKTTLKSLGPKNKKIDIAESKRANRGYKNKKPPKLFKNRQVPNKTVERVFHNPLEVSTPSYEDPKLKKTALIIPAKIEKTEEPIVVTNPIEEKKETDTEEGKDGKLRAKRKILSLGGPEIKTLSELMKNKWSKPDLERARPVKVMIPNLSNVDVKSIPLSKYNRENKKKEDEEKKEEDSFSNKFFNLFAPKVSGDKPKLRMPGKTILTMPKITPKEEEKNEKKEKVKEEEEKVKEEEEKVKEEEEKAKEDEKKEKEDDKKANEEETPEDEELRNSSKKDSFLKGSRNIIAPIVLPGGDKKEEDTGKLRSKGNKKKKKEKNNEEKILLFKDIITGNPGDKKPKKPLLKREKQNINEEIFCDYKV